MSQLVSAVFIESVVSSTSITLAGAAEPPRAVAAVAVAPIVSDFTLLSGRKNVGTVACCLTVDGSVHVCGRKASGTPTLARHFSLGIAG